MKRPAATARLAKLCFLACLLAVKPELSAQTSAVDFQQINRDLNGQYSILLENGNRQKGEIVSWDGESMQLEFQLGGGSARMTISAEEIRDVAFPGDNYLKLLREWTADPARSKDALALFRELYKQRGPFLQYLDEDELDLFVRYARFSLEQGDPLMAVSVIGVLRPYIEDAELLKSLDDATLLGFFLGGMEEKAQTQARSWIESADPAGSSALGWRILAEIFYRDEQYEDAFWTALYPVAFANQMPMEHLDACYAFAIATAEINRQDDVKLRLHQEMRDRKLLWPDNIPVLADLEPKPPEPAAAEAELKVETTSNTGSETGGDEPQKVVEDTEPEPEPDTPAPKPSNSMPTRLPQISP